MPLFVNTLTKNRVNLNVKSRVSTTLQLFGFTSSPVLNQHHQQRTASKCITFKGIVPTVRIPNIGWYVKCWLFSITTKSNTHSRIIELLWIPCRSLLFTIDYLIIIKQHICPVIMFQSIADVMTTKNTDISLQLSNTDERLWSKSKQPTIRTTKQPTTLHKHNLRVHFRPKQFKSSACECECVCVCVYDSTKLARFTHIPRAHSNHRMAIIQTTRTSINIWSFDPNRQRSGVRSKPTRTHYQREKKNHTFPDACRGVLGHTTNTHTRTHSLLYS